VAQNATSNHESRNVPITELAESVINPRKSFDAKGLQELAASFETQGILAPLLVLELQERKYEVIAGHVASERQNWPNSKNFLSA
jgi:ParB family transcriptional regulator, chromosome partitioning protein